MRPIRVLSTSIGWLPWGAPAFARARDERKPVLLSIAASWCQGCREMDDTTYADPAVATCINERFIPVRVDAEERPDISERYALGGWPTTAFLTAGGALLGGGTYVPLERMPGTLERVLAAVEANAALLDGVPAAEIPPVRAAAASGPDGVEDLIAVTYATADRECGGFGTGPKYPIAAPVHLALDLWSDTHDPSYEQFVVTTLDAMGWSGLYDEVDGGFHHYTATRDWRLAHTEKLLETNAALIPAVPRRGRAPGHRALHRARRRRPPVRADVARRTGRGRMVRLAAGRRGVLRVRRGRAPPADVTGDRPPPVHRLERRDGLGRASRR